MGRQAGRRRRPIATGTAALRDDGTFDFTFTPKADEREAAGGKKAAEVTCRYAATADVTDEGGETRSADRRFRLGAVAVEARMSRDTAFFLESEKAAATLVRTDLDGTPRPGKGTWRLVRLSQPATTVLPPTSRPPRYPRTPTANPAPPASRRRSRRATGSARAGRRGYSPEERMRGWKDGAEAARGEATHDAKGEAKVAFRTLAAGAYRLRYETVDDFGARFSLRGRLRRGGARRSPCRSRRCSSPSRPR